MYDAKLHIQTHLMLYLIIFKLHLSIQSSLFAVCCAHYFIHWQDFQWMIVVNENIKPKPLKELGVFNAVVETQTTNLSESRGGITV